MSRRKPSTFRDALQVSPERIALLNEFELGQLMSDLLRAQAHRCGSPLSEVRVNTEEKAADAGSDGWTGKPATKDEWLGDAETCWQFKAGTAGEPARLTGEVGKPLPKRTLQTGGSFVVVAAGSTNGKKGEEDRLKALTTEASKAGIPPDRIRVIGSEGLTLWCNQNPAVSARWAGRPPGLWRLPDWLMAEGHQVPWHATDSTNSEIARQREALDFGSGSVQHLHIVGPPGVGKTRLALELCRDAPWSSFVIYVRQASDERLVPLIDEAVEDHSVRLVVVADEVAPAHLEPLRDAIGRANGRIRLITIGHCPTPDPTRILPLPVAPLDQESASKIIRSWHPGMPLEHVGFIVRFADGYVRLARLAADAVARNPSLDVRGLLDLQEIRRFLDDMLGAGDRRALHVVSVLHVVGWTENVSVEGEAIARHFGLDWNDVRAKVDDFDRRLGIVPRGGRYRYVSPTPLGTYLAVEAWTTYPELLRSLPDALPTENAKDAYYERLRSIASNPQARIYAQNELPFFSRLDDFVHAHAVRRWSSLSAADPEQAAASIFRALNGTAPRDRSRIGDGARREMVSTLVQLAWRPHAFSDAAKSLALLAEAENEPWSNNATAEFVRRFQIYMGGTPVPYFERLAVLDDLVATDRPPLLRLSIQALALVGARQAFRIGGQPHSDEVPGVEWYPSSNEEHFECILTALQRLTMLANKRKPELEKDFVSATPGLAMMLRDYRTVRSAVVALFEAVRTAYPNTREALRRAIADVIYQERKYWNELPHNELTELDAIHAQFEDASLPSRVQQLVGPFIWERDDEPDLRPLARELIESPGTLNEIWPWLTEGNAARAWRLGEVVAEEDHERRLLVTKHDMSGVGTDFRFLSGYVHVIRKLSGDNWYDDWVLEQSRTRPRPLKMVFEVAWRCGATSQVARCLQEILQSEPVPSAIVGQLSFGPWGENLDREVLEDLLRVMVERGHEATALTILEHRTKTQLSERGIWQSLALKLLSTSNLVRSGHMTSYYWKMLALRYVDEHAAEIASAIIREQGDRSSGCWFAQHSEAAIVLQACVERDPQAVWRALQPHLLVKPRSYAFTAGFPRGILDQVPSDDVIAWLGADPGERAPAVAKLAIMDFSSDATLASRTVGGYGDDLEVAEAFFSEYTTGSWTGPSSAHWDKLATTLEEVVRRTELAKLKQWAVEAARRLRKMAIRSRQREEEDEIRGK